MEPKKQKKKVNWIIIAIIAVVLVAAVVVLSVVLSQNEGADSTDGIIVISEDAYNTDSMAVTAGNDIVLTFNKNKKFAKAIESVTLDGGENILADCTITNESITIPKTYFEGKNDEKTYVIEVLATGYEVCKISQKVYPEDTWTMIWNDEFDGKELDLSKWSYQYGTGKQYGLDSWGNAEQEYYQEENVAVANGLLTITAKKEEERIESKSYTSGRIRTVTDEDEILFTTKYGKIEAKMKLPDGNGLWPAFWMLPDLTTNPYGGWPMSGEIDIMEARGRLLEVVGGTIHYGQVWPNNRYSGGEYEMPEGEDITQYHVYGIEWEPSEIRWYVDGKLYHKETNWYSRGAGEKTDYEYPAPYNQEFYILFNLAVGGNYDSGRTPNPNTDMPALMQVDYVRVYEKVGGYDEANAKPTTEVDEEASALYIKNDVDYNYIQDLTYSTINLEAQTARDMDVNSSNWYFLALGEYGGAATLDITEDALNTYASVNVTDVGSQTYSIQMIQHMPLVKGYIYEISFDAKATEDRSILVKFGGDDDNAWVTYAGQFTEEVTTELQHFSETFTMMNDSDPTARLELNLGGDLGEISIANLQLKVTNLRVE